MKCDHSKTKVLYDQGNKAQGRKLRGVADQCQACGHIEPRRSCSFSEATGRPEHD